MKTFKQHIHEAKNLNDLSVTRLKQIAGDKTDKRWSTAQRLLKTRQTSSPASHNQALKIAQSHYDKNEPDKLRKHLNALDDEHHKHVMSGLKKPKDRQNNHPEVMKSLKTDRNKLSYSKLSKEDKHRENERTLKKVQKDIDNGKAFFSWNYHPEQSEYVVNGLKKSHKHLFKHETTNKKQLSKDQALKKARKLADKNDDEGLATLYSNLSDDHADHVDKGLEKTHSNTMGYWQRHSKDPK